MLIQARGTHKVVNESLMRVVALCPQVPYGLAVWVYDDIKGYVAPISSLNLKNHDNVDIFNDQFLRTKIPLNQSAVGDFVKANGQIEKSKNFSNHRLSHHYIGQSSMILQIVSDRDGAITLNEMSNELVTLTENIRDYAAVQRFSYESVFGLKEGPRDTHVVACDINGFTQYTAKEQSKLENIINESANEVTETHDVKIMQILGDQVRFSHDHDFNYSRYIHRAFYRELSRQFGRNVAIGSIAAHGEIRQSFNGHYGDIRADKHYKGDVLTKIGTALKTRDRQGPSFLMLR